MDVPTLHVYSSLRLTICYIFLVVNKSHNKTKTDNVLACLAILSDFPTLLWLSALSHILLPVMK